MAFKKSNREINIFSMSALDLFASALGAFIIIAVIALPYYLKVDPDLVAKLQRAKATLKKEKDKHTKTKQKLADARKEKEKQAKENKKTKAKLASLNTQLSKFKPQDVDVVFVLDATASMGNQIAGLQAQIYGISRVMKKVSKTLRIGFVVYRDYQYSPVTFSFPIRNMDSTGLAALKRFIDGIKATSHPQNTHIPEAVVEGMKAANAMSFRAKAKKIMVVIGDAPSVNNTNAQCYQIARSFKARGNAFVSAIYVYTPRTGADAKYLPLARQFFKQLTIQGGGRFVAERGGMLESVLLSIL